ncbi:hypothetical protein Thein_1150 [Thermodesulfatator indicus DSM 15286]|uniref:Uncharacterized protein n=1 Tax=Thermodesulfatator indicus (strain DSM 15286 / JCM 11887 / CIR29812) TaxID=667014 RepID=F8A826_THEID|nr:zinc ribbon domain-containing protein [Thermodesulfatator indicus]AEH45019.1 hypothetical protein Thein_1150 [Thermodesulfatator indicus DSM 15286]
MRCPKCSYIVAEYFKTCPECSNDLTELSEFFGPFPEIKDEFWDSLYQVLEGSSDLHEEIVEEDAFLNTQEDVLSEEDVIFNELLEDEAMEDLDLLEEKESSKEESIEPLNLETAELKEDIDIEFEDIELDEEDLEGAFLEDISPIEENHIETKKAEEVLNKADEEIFDEEVPELELLADLEGVEEILPEELKGDKSSQG